ncbi:hypothetical protein VTJ83DRAFT_1863 [Remersonia thermophila]|uniref:DUF4048 domain-containing protein n=1 Tax=Remersonia thermophila TaxID=72144 RepID=A0ABR4DHB0_9PEZI
MTSTALVRICFFTACANALFNTRDSHPLLLHKVSVVARRTTRAGALLCPPPRYTRRSLAALRPGRRRRAPWTTTYHHPALLPPAPLPKSSRSFPWIRAVSTEQKPAAPPPTETPASNMDEMILLQKSIDETMRNGASTPERRHPAREGSCDETKPRRLPDDGMGSPQSNGDDLIETRSSRSASTTSRSTKRLSLTLPIAPPNPYPTRPAPASSTAATFPLTPLDTPHMASPLDPSDFITAIAAQERRVLELREELREAEAELAKLKKQWATHEAYKKRGPRRHAAEHVPASVDNQDETAVRRSLELDRRKALLTQQSQQATPEKSRRRVFTGSHTRTLSLLSPSKPDETFSEKDGEANMSKTDSTPGSAPLTPSGVPKRASWAPRSTQTAGVKQLAEDLKAGLWTFMEDLRQATVGDEPITGHGAYMRSRDGSMRPTSDQDTIRASSNARSRLSSSAFDEAAPRAATKQSKDSEGENDVGSAQRPGLRRSKTEAGTRTTTKRFSWTPLTMDEYDDNDWSNWDIPNSASPRWSGTTVNGDIIPSVPEKQSEDAEAGSLRSKSSKSPLSHPSTNATTTATTTSVSAAAASLLMAPLNPAKLEELLPQALNKLAPSNLKRTAADFMKEWEKSLVAPAEGGGQTTSATGATSATS